MIEGMTFLRSDRSDHWICTRCVRKIEYRAGIKPQCPMCDRSETTKALESWLKGLWGGPFSQRSIVPPIYANSNQQLGQQMQSAYLEQLMKYQSELLKQQQYGLYGRPPEPDTIPEIPIVEPPDTEPTPIPPRRAKRCYVCARDPHEWPAVSRAPGEPAYCEEHRKK